MIKEQHKIFIKNNKKIISEIFQNKLTDLTKELFDAPTEHRDKMIDAINVLRDWLREIDIIDNQVENKKDNFI